MTQTNKMIRLGDTATFINGYAFKPDHWGDEGLPIIRIQNLNNKDAEFNFYDGIVPEKYIVHDGDILISWSASLGVYEWNRGDALLNQHIFKVVFDKVPIDKHYLMYAVQSKLSDMGKAAHGATMRHIIKSDFDSILIPYPPVDVQKRIVKELDLISGILIKILSQIETIDALAHSVFFEMFGDPVSNDMGWNTGKMADVAPQKAYPGSIPSINGKYWLLNLDMVESQTGRILEKSLFEPSEIGNSTTTFNTDNILYSKLRPYLNKVVIPIEPGYCTSELVPLLPKKGIINRCFLAYLLRSKFFVDYINSRVAGAKMPRVSMSDFRGFDVIIPPLRLQNIFQEKITALEKQKERIKDSLPLAEALLASRMEQFFC